VNKKYKFGGRFSFFSPSPLMGKTYLLKIRQIEEEKDKKEKVS